jgi:GH25 family lysozyme M1 (1,4-beta-N-acetylmuramidase)
VWQPPALVDWRAQDFGIVRATYGAKPDRLALEHVKRVRGAGKVVGLYHFFLGHLEVRPQVDAFLSVAEKAGLTVGDLLPAIDVEDYPGHVISPADLPALTSFDAQIRSHFAGSMIYTTQRDWARIGKPAWYLERPLWVAHYPKLGSKLPLAKAATPGGAPWRIHQCIVGPIVPGAYLQAPKHARAVDQNIATEPLPVIRLQAEPEADPAVPWLFLTDDDWAEMQNARDIRARDEEP